MPKRKDWKSLLLKQQEKDGGKILTDLDKKLNTTTVIKFICNCNEIDEKKARYIIENSGLYCKKCKKHNMINKCKKTSTQLKNWKILLLNQLKKDESTLITNINNYINSHTIIYYKCKCNNNKIYSKMARYIIENSGMVCEKCKTINTINKAQRTAYSLKKYIYKNGKTVYIQGDEKFALDLLQLQGYTDTDIITGIKNVPVINYFFNINRTYYPDIYIPKENRIIEVKSSWTYKIEEEKNLKKKEACINANYNFEFWIFNRKKKLVIK